MQCYANLFGCNIQILTEFPLTNAVMPMESMLNPTGWWWWWSWSPSFPYLRVSPCYMMYAVGLLRCTPALQLAQHQDSPLSPTPFFSFPFPTPFHPSAIIGYLQRPLLHTTSHHSHVLHFRDTRKPTVSPECKFQQSSSLLGLGL